MISRKSTKHSIRLDTTPLKQVEEVKYLGATLSADGRPDKNLNARIATTGRLYGALS